MLLSVLTEQADFTEMNQYGRTELERERHNKDKEPKPRKRSKKPKPTKPTSDYNFVRTQTTRLVKKTKLGQDRIAVLNRALAGPPWRPRIKGKEPKPETAKNLNQKNCHLF